MSRLHCPYLKGVVELTTEREQHIRERHPDLLPEHADLIAEALAAPDLVRRSARLAHARLFTRRFDTIEKHVVVVVMSESVPVARHGVVTAYLARRLAGGDVEWQRS